MRILQGILSESKEYYQDLKKKIAKKLLVLPRGSIKERVIAGKKYYYLQYRKAEKIVQKYLGRQKPEVLTKQIKERGILKEELKKVNEALKIIIRSEGRKHV
ncbi:MAG TPA: hypothetical protein P5110_04610 [Candidatus Omnitrophota bacterium]|nr:hypothetical protein [Candidatus Omnitrophota bacterium]HRZ14774.1 hypothetical protein [Candidatus Omnitrophota bacterium]